MSLVADESIDRPIVERLRRRGLEVTFVAELELRLKGGWHLLAFSLPLPDPRATGPS